MDVLVEAEREAKIQWFTNDPLLPWDKISVADQDNLIWIQIVKMELPYRERQQFLALVQ